MILENKEKSTKIYAHVVQQKVISITNIVNKITTYQRPIIDIL